MTINSYPKIKTRSEKQIKEDFKIGQCKDCFYKNSSNPYILTCDYIIIKGVSRGDNAPPNCKCYLKKTK